MPRLFTDDLVAVEDGNYPISPKPKPKILIIDDDDGVREIVSMLLDQQGFETVEAADGKTALRLAAEIHFNAVLCDNLMPGMCGTEVVTRLRARPDTAHTPIILSSGRMDTLDESILDFCTYLLPKPFLPRELAAVMTAALATD
ncbi:MAG TPA: response regulator [Candidatus Acidoferrum sp.]|nr:response regulator [Candidatus Acidoferrum sp.]